MKAIDIAGIPFTAEMLDSLNEWLVPVSENEKSLVACNVAELDKIQSFLMRHWDDLPDGVFRDVKDMLTSIQEIKDRMTLFSNIGYK